MSPWMLLQIGWKAVPAVILLVGFSLLLSWLENVRTNRRWKREIQLGIYSSKLVQERIAELSRENVRLKASDAEKTETIKAQADVISSMRALLGVHDGREAAAAIEKAGAGRTDDAAGRVPAAGLNRRSQAGGR